MGNKYNAVMITLARETRGLTQSELASKLSVLQGSVSRLESGTSVITEDVVQAIARVLDYPESFFLQTDQVHPFGSTTFYHRRLQSVPAGILRTIEAKVNVYRFHISRLLRATDLDKRCMFKRMSHEDYGVKVEEIAGLVRASWRLRPGPVPNLIRAIEGAGGIVVRFDFGTPKMFGLSEWNPPCPPLFFLNDNPDISADRDRFTLAHELGHIILHAMPSPDMEKEANRFASEFLMPAKEIRAHLQPPIKLHTVARLKPYWKVAMAALIERAHNLDIINDNQHVYLRIQLQQKGYGRREPVELDIPREQPTLLNDIIQAHVSDLGFGHSQIAEMVNMKPLEFRAFHRLNNVPGGLRLVG